MLDTATERANAVRRSNHCAGLRNASVKKWRSLGRKRFATSSNTRRRASGWPALANRRCWHSMKLYSSGSRYLHEVVRFQVSNQTT